MEETTGVYSIGISKSKSYSAYSDVTIGLIVAQMNQRTTKNESSDIVDPWGKPLE